MEVNLEIFLKLLKINAAVISGLRLKKVNLSLCQILIYDLFLK